MKYIYPKQIIYLHKRIIESTGGQEGLRDTGLLESAVYRPMATFGGQELYPDIFDKASALIHSLISNHPFFDGNKRTSYESMRIFLRINGYDIEAPDNQKYKFVMDIANHKLNLSDITNWIKHYSVKL
ncbi:MAG: type II toxin-antitoxin system death-on-curing family toxin [Elusimicrobia bacterium CG02_land_8_20_14_3_00_37_13]|nr:MAG: type II toxin-antitoxin system death-on-curing family toxin [Elusimicrobia bacterium CG02_land_8_20_14_3_00_37_13]